MQLLEMLAEIGPNHFLPCSIAQGDNIRNIMFSGTLPPMKNTEECLSS